METNDIAKENIINVECLVVLRILFHLGYVGNREFLFETNEYNDESLYIIDKSQKKIINEINNAIKESQL